MTDQSLITLAENFGAEVGRYEGKAVWIKFHSSTDLEAFAAALAREQEAQPCERASGHVFANGACAFCGSAQPAAQRKTLEQMAAEAALEQDPELAQPAAQEPDELLRKWIKAIGVNPELNRWNVSREDVLQLIRAARSKP